MHVTPSAPTLSDVQAANTRLAPFIQQTPILSSALLNQWLGGHNILFKAECLQTTGAFKIRGALNTLLKRHADNTLPQRVICNSSGNHAQAVAYATQQLNIPCEVYCPATISAVKRQATEHYGATVHLCETRKQADDTVKQRATEPGVLWIPPYNHPDIIAGQGSLLLDTLQQVPHYDAVFAPCGGGGLLAGSLLVHQYYQPNSTIIGAEPAAADDAIQSLRAGKIVSLKQSPTTLADGAATLSVGHHTFPLLQQLDDLIAVSEEDIIYWTQWLHHLLKIHVEPTCAMSMTAVCQWLKRQTQPQTVLVLLSGGNISAKTLQQIWQTDRLTIEPSLIN